MSPMWKIGAHSPSWIPPSNNQPDRQTHWPRKAVYAMKTWWHLAAVSFAMFAGFRPGIVAAQSGPPVRDIGSEARGVFATKCTGCHGSDLAKPECRFGYVLDLKRIAANPELVIPLRPDESELWVLVQRGEMPPADSPQGSLTRSQREIIRTWIAAGAPKASAGAVDSSPSVQSESTTLALTTADRWVGKVHLLRNHRHHGPLRRAQCPPRRLKSRRTAPADFRGQGMMATGARRSDTRPIH